MGKCHLGFILKIENLILKYKRRVLKGVNMFGAFTKSDLKSHMVVRLRDGRVGVIFGNYIITAFSVIFKNYYNDDLTMSGRKDIDIVQVFDHLDFSSVLDNSVLIWDRQREEEIKEVTMAEVEKKFGCKIKIVNG